MNYGREIHSKLEGSAARTHSVKLNKGEKLSLKKRSVHKTLMEVFFIEENVNKQRSKGYSAFSIPTLHVAALNTAKLLP